MRALWFQLYGNSCTLFEVVTLNWYIWHYACIINKQFCKASSYQLHCSFSTQLWQCTNTKQSVGCGANSTNQNPNMVCDLIQSGLWKMKASSRHSLSWTRSSMYIVTHPHNGRNDEIENTNPNNEIMLKFYHSSQVHHHSLLIEARLCTNRVRSMQKFA